MDCKHPLTIITMTTDLHVTTPLELWKLRLSNCIQCEHRVRNTKQYDTSWLLNTGRQPSSSLQYWKHIHFHIQDTSKWTLSKTVKRLTKWTNDLSLEVQNENQAHESTESGRVTGGHSTLLRKGRTEKGHPKCNVTATKEDGKEGEGRMSVLTMLLSEILA